MPDDFFASDALNAAEERAPLQARSDLGVRSLRIAVELDDENNDGMFAIPAPAATTVAAETNDAYRGGDANGMESAADEETAFKLPSMALGRNRPPSGGGGGAAAAAKRRVIAIDDEEDG